MVYPGSQIACNPSFIATITYFTLVNQSKKCGKNAFSTCGKYVVLKKKSYILNKLNPEEKMSWKFVLSEDDYRLYKENISLLEEQVIRNFPDGYKDISIISAIRNVPRHFFVNESYRYLAYTDNAFPTSGGLTTSAPSVIAEMIFNVCIRRGDKLLEIGTGTGYEAAVLAEMGVKVFTIEIDRRIAEKANRILVDLGYKIDKQLKNNQRRKECIKRFNKIKTHFHHREKIELFWGNGHNGLEEYSPFKGIIVAASISHIKHIKTLVNQLSPSGGKLIVPIGSRYEQTMHIIERKADKINTCILKGISFNFIRMVLKPERYADSGISE